MTNEKEYFIENLAMLTDSGMDILSALKALQKEARSYRMKKMLDRLWESIYEGSALSSALEKVRFGSAHAVSLIRTGERSGRLVENLQVVALQSQRDRMFRSKLRSAMMYPLFVLVLAAVVGLGIAWFILPRLASVFASLDVELPAVTKALIATGDSLRMYGAIAIPVAIGFLFVFFYFIFVFPRTKFIGQNLLYIFPGARGLLQEIELARMGYLLGTLLEAGLPVVEAIQSLAEATNFPRYRAFYAALAKLVEEGNSFERSFRQIKGAHRRIPPPIQQMIAAGEQSGRLAETLKKIGAQYDARTDTTTKNLAVILEPILLVIVWIGVMFVAIAVILPIYNLIGGLKTS